MFVLHTVFFTLLVSKGKNLVHLIDREDDAHCFRLHKGRVFYVSEASMRLGISVARSNLVSLGTCLGKFSNSGKFKLHITSLDYLAQYAKYKVSFEPTLRDASVQMVPKRCGLNQMARCLSCTAITSSRRIWAASPRTHRSIRVLLCTAWMMFHWYDSLKSIQSPFVIVRSCRDLASLRGQPWIHEN